MNVIVIEPDAAIRMRTRSSLEIVAMSEGVDVDLHIPTMEDVDTLLRVGDQPDVILATVPEGDLIRSVKSLVRKAGSAPVCVLSSTQSASLRIEARRAGAEWIPTTGGEPDYREIWRRLRGAAAYSHSRPEIERRTLSAILVALEELSDSIGRLPALQVTLERKGPLKRSLDWAADTVPPSVLRAIVWVLCALVAIIGGLLGIDLGTPTITEAVP